LPSKILLKVRGNQALSESADLLKLVLFHKQQQTTDVIYVIIALCLHVPLLLLLFCWTMRVH